MIQSEKVQQVYDHLRQQIDSGNYSAGDRLPTDEELCETFSLSRPTVAKALRELERLGMVERKRRAGTFVKQSTQDTLLFGLLVPRLGTTEIFEPICAGIAKGLQDAGHAVLWTSGTDTQGIQDNPNTDKSVLEAGRQLIQKRVAGVFFAPLELSENRQHINQAIADMLADAKIPVVLLDRDHLPYPQRSQHDLIGIDNHRAGHMLASHLVEQGAKKIAFLAHRESANTVETRIAGYRDAMENAGLGNHVHILRCPPSETAKIKQLLRSFKPDAIMCGNDATAAQLMQTLSDLNVSVPHDVMVTGFDDVRYASLLTPPLTTIHQPCSAIGQAAVELMVSRLNNPKRATRHLVIHADLIKRQSTERR